MVPSDRHATDDLSRQGRLIDDRHGVWVDRHHDRVGHVRGVRTCRQGLRTLLGTASLTIERLRDDRAVMRRTEAVKRSVLWCPSAGGKAERCDHLASGRVEFREAITVDRIEIAIVENGHGPRIVPLAGWCRIDQLCTRSVRGSPDRSWQRRRRWRTERCLSRRRKERRSWRPNR